MDFARSTCVQTLLDIFLAFSQPVLPCCTLFRIENALMLSLFAVFAGVGARMASKANTRSINAYSTIIVTTIIV